MLGHHRAGSAPTQEGEGVERCALTDSLGRRRVTARRAPAAHRGGQQRPTPPCRVLELATSLSTAIAGVHTPHWGVRLWATGRVSGLFLFEESKSPVLVQSSECHLTLENCVFSGMNESMNAESQIIYCSLIADPRPTVLFELEIRR